MLSQIRSIAWHNQCKMQLKPSSVKFRLFFAQNGLNICTWLSSIFTEHSPTFVCFALLFKTKHQRVKVTTFCIMTETKCTIENSLFLWTTEWMQHCRFFLTIEYPFLYCCLPETTFFLQSYSFTELVSISPGLITFPRWNCWQHNKILSYAWQILKYWACGAKVVQSYTVE